MVALYYLDRFYKTTCIAVTLDCALRAVSHLAPGCKPARVCVWPEEAPEVIEVFCKGGPSLKLMREASPSLLSQYYAGEKDCFEL